MITFKAVKYLSKMPKNAGTTVGYWRWSKKNNKGNLVIYCLRMSSWRFMLAVFGHECLEALWCWLFNITTEECDRYDVWSEEQYEKGLAPYTEEMAFRKGCPYRGGHVLGSLWEYFIIYATLGSWKKYETECNKIMRIKDA